MNPSLFLRFAIVFSCISFLVCWLTYRILSRRLALKPRLNRLLLAFLVLAGILMVAGPVSFRVLNSSAESLPDFLLQWSQFFIMGWIGSVFIVFLFLELVNLLAKPFDPKRRVLLTEGIARGALGITTASSVFGMFEANAGPEIQEIEVRLARLPQSFSGFRIAQISDVHVGPLIHRDYLENVVERVLSLNPDAIFITGDLVDGTVDQLREQIAPLKRLKAPSGVFFCTGNHEYYSGVEEWLTLLRSFGIEVLENSNRLLTRAGTTGPEHLMIAGVHDHSAPRYDSGHTTDPDLAGRCSTPVDCRILLAHNPFSIKEAVRSGFDLQVSGHTHAGQFYPYTFLVKLFLKYSEGLYQVNERTQLYVNRGTGYWGPPNRLGKRSEITHLTLRRS